MWNDAALQKAPEVLNAVGVDDPINVAFGMGNELMGEVAAFAERFVGTILIRIHVRTAFHVGPDLTLKRIGVMARHMLYDLARAAPDSGGQRHARRSKEVDGSNL